jgi:hypothetical protein
MSRSAGSLDDRALALGISDAFLTLKNAGKMTIEILPARLREILPCRKQDAVASAEQLLREACYNEFRQSIDTSLSGGDHCDFFPLGHDRRGLIIFDVSGHEARASRIRDELVEMFDEIQDRTKPARVMETLNRTLWNTRFRRTCSSVLFMVCWTAPSTLSSTPTPVITHRTWRATINSLNSRTPMAWRSIFSTLPTQPRKSVCAPWIV